MAGLVPPQGARQAGGTRSEDAVKVVIASDLHANLEALAVLPHDYDQLWILGDLVNYGPNPAEVVEFVRSHASLVLRGNHDQFLGTGDDPRCTERFQEIALAAGRFSQWKLGTLEKKYLSNLPLQLELQVGHTRFWLCHAMPSDPLYGYSAPDSDRWKEECVRVPADVLLVGHTHVPFVRKFGDCLVVNPGSLGLPNNRSSLACFAVWEDGSLTLHSTLYDVGATIAKVEAMPVLGHVKEDLVALLRTGSVREREANDVRLASLRR
jgi:putative phosphoesterase